MNKKDNYWYQWLYSMLTTVVYYITKVHVMHGGIISMERIYEPDFCMEWQLTSKYYTPSTSLLRHHSRSVPPHRISTAIGTSSPLPNSLCSNSHNARPHHAPRPHHIYSDPITSTHRLPHHNQNVVQKYFQLKKNILKSNHQCNFFGK